MDVKAFRAAGSQEMTLPSGRAVLIKRVSLMDLIEQGGIPDSLSGLVAELANREKTRSLEMEELRRYIDVVNITVKACMVEPEVRDTPGEDHLGVSEIDFVDRTAIYQWANGSAAALRPFRGERKARTFHAS